MGNSSTDQRVADAERFEQWWAKHAIHERGHDVYLIHSYESIARAAWMQALGHIPKSHADERIERLEDRAQYLRNKIFNWRPQSMYRAKAELSALEWAIPIVTRATAAPQEGR